ncbi:MAG: hypothetical protein ABJM02_18250 [Paracoccaceae bacterium]
MQSPEYIATQIADQIGQLPTGSGRKLIAIAGPPASGKTTVSHALLEALNASHTRAGLLAMDGFHLDNTILDARGQRAQKGAPDTFDFGSFQACLKRLQTEEEVIAPTFDRTRDVSVGSSTIITPQMRTVIVEGNYLLLNDAPWCDLRAYWTFAAMITADRDTLEQRLIERWVHHGFSPQEARAKALENDIPNAVRVLTDSAEADLTIEV